MTEFREPKSKSSNINSEERSYIKFVSPSFKAYRQYTIFNEYRDDFTGTDSLEDINVYISDTKLKDLRHKQKKSIKERLLKFIGFTVPMEKQEFENSVRRLYKCCLRGVTDLHELHIRRSIGLEILSDIVERGKSEYLTISHVIHVTWSIMSCMHHFQLRIKIGSYGIVTWARKKQVEYCMELYNKLIKLFKEPKQRVALNAIIVFYKEGRLWDIEMGCTEMILRLFDRSHCADEGIDDILYNIEVSTLINTEEAQYLLQILYEIMKQIRWNKIPDYLLIKFLNMVESSIRPRLIDKYNYVPLRQGLDICIRYMITSLNKVDLIKMIFHVVNKINDNPDNSEIIACLGNLSEFAAITYNKKTRKIPLSKGPLPIAFSLFHLKKSNMSMVGLKIWQHVIDRKKNIDKFLAPKIFFQYFNYNLDKNKCDEQDKVFFKKMRHLIFDIIFSCFYISEDIMGIENVYKTVALTLYEIPCGYSASCFVTIAMSIQEHAFTINSKDPVKSHHLHATAMSILTLICHIHKAKVFYEYVTTIMERRAEWAPHLNPPLRAHYEYALHHILWNKPELFFEDWEARYGLWKCFRKQQTQTKMNQL